MATCGRLDVAVAWTSGSGSRGCTYTNPLRFRSIGQAQPGLKPARANLPNLN